MEVCTFLPLTRHLSYDWCDLSGGPSRHGAPCKVGASCPMLDVRNYLFLVRFLHIPCIGTWLHTHSVRHFSVRIYTVPCDEATDCSTLRICHAKKTKHTCESEQQNAQGFPGSPAFSINVVMGPARSSCSTFQFPFSTFVLFMDLNQISSLQLPSWWCRNAWISINTWFLGTNQLFYGDPIYRIFNFSQFCHMCSVDMNNYCKLGFSMKRRNFSFFIFQHVQYCILAI